MEDISFTFWEVTFSISYFLLCKLNLSVYVFFYFSNKLKCFIDFIVNSFSWIISAIREIHDYHLLVWVNGKVTLNGAFYRIWLNFENFSSNFFFIVLKNLLKFPLIGSAMFECLESRFFFSFYICFCSQMDSPSWLISFQFHPLKSSLFSSLW